MVLFTYLHKWYNIGTGGAVTGTGGAVTGTGGAVCKGATPSVEQPGGRGFKPRLRSLLD